MRLSWPHTLSSFSPPGALCWLAAASLQRYQHLFDVNEKNGTFYLQSKVHRAMERLEAELKDREAEQKGSGGDMPGKE